MSLTPGQISNNAPSQPISQTPHFPTYANARHFLRIVAGVSYAVYKQMYEQIRDQRGSPQEQESWTKPDEWIGERLSGASATLARRIWQESQRELNPRHTAGVWWFSSRHRLLTRGPNDGLQLTERGKEFLEQEQGPLVAEIDTYDGVLVVLRLVAERGPGRRSDFLPEYATYCRSATTTQSEAVIKMHLYARLSNLIDRDLVVRRGQTYQMTEAGLAYLKTGVVAVSEPALTSRQTELLKLAAAIRAESRERLADYLSTMDPFRFEALIALLLEEMGYTDVETTAPVNDKGVDVVANIELGISSVREVVQVKRHKANIHRKTLDELRGSLHRFQAVRGTIISTGSFSRGTVEAAFERGAAPITLIDGEKLLDLLIQYQIGITKKTVEYFEFDAHSLDQIGLSAQESLSS